MFKLYSASTRRLWAASCPLEGLFQFLITRGQPQKNKKPEPNMGTLLVGGLEHEFHFSI